VESRYWKSGHRLGLMPSLEDVKEIVTSHSDGPSESTWGSKTQIRSSGKSVVFVDQPAEQVATPHISSMHR
jgi:hypothetical protein